MSTFLGKAGLCPGVNSMGLAAIAFGDQDGFEQCYHEFAPDSAVEFQGEREKTPCFELVERVERDLREEGRDVFHNTENTVLQESFAQEEPNDVFVKWEVFLHAHPGQGSEDH